MTLYSSRPPFNDDPFPYVGPTGSRHRYPGTLDGVRLAHDPHPHFARPQNNPTNPILAEFRHYRDGQDHDWLSLFLDRLDPYSGFYVRSREYPSEQIDHARRVLTRLARFAEES